MPHSWTDAETPAAAAHFLALGDSYTIGEAIEESGRWPRQLAERLKAEGFRLAAPKIVAKTGWTTDELSAAIENASVREEYDMVSLLIGVNNQYRGRDVREYQSQLNELLVRAVRFADSQSDRVFVLSIPDWGVTPFAADRNPNEIRREIDAFNKVKSEACQQLGIAYVDITPVSRRAAENSRWVADDGLHPSALMYREWVELALPIARQILSP